MRPTPVIATQRLRLRGMRAADARALHVPLSDAELMRYWSSAPKRTLEETREYLNRPRSDEWRWWIIADARSDRALGWVSTGTQRQGGVSEIGYILAREAQGSGLAREAVTAVIDYLFTVERDRRVFADTDPDNAASIGLLTQLGFTLEGRLRGEWETHIGVRDSLIWGLLREEWMSARGAGERGVAATPPESAPAHG